MLTIASAAAVLALLPSLQVDPASTLLKYTPAIALCQYIDSLILSTDFYSALLAIVLSGCLTPCIAIVFVLFGAPATDYITGTLLCSAVFTLLAVTPMISKYGLEYSHWKNAAGLGLPLTEITGGFWLSILGAWLGAVPIALDWDRPWQQWPITVLVGSAVGALIGNLLGLVVSTSKDDKYGLEKQAKADKRALKLQKERARESQKDKGNPQGKSK